MELKIIPTHTFKKEEKRQIQEIIKIAEKLLIKNKIPLPSSIIFYNSFSKFIRKVLPEVQEYGFNKKVAKEIIKCSLNNGTYGTIDYSNNSIIEMNFNPFNHGEYTAKDFLELIIHESMHLYLAKSMNKDINNLKFRFKNNQLISNKEIIQIDEGFAEFMTKKIMDNINLELIKKIKIPKKNNNGPKYKRETYNVNITNFDKLFENILISNRTIGLKMFMEIFNFKEENEKILNSAIIKLKSIL